MSTDKMSHLERHRATTMVEDLDQIFSRMLRPHPREPKPGAGSFATAERADEANAWVMRTMAPEIAAWVASTPAVTMSPWSGRAVPTRRNLKVTLPPEFAETSIARDRDGHYAEYVTNSVFVTLDRYDGDPDLPYGFAERTLYPDAHADTRRATGRSLLSDLVRTDTWNDPRLQPLARAAMWCMCDPAADRDWTIGYRPPGRASRTPCVTLDRGSRGLRLTADPTDPTRLVVRRVGSWPKSASRHGRDTWPDDGLDATLASMRDVMRGKRPAEWFRMGTPEAFSVMNHDGVLADGVGRAWAFDGRDYRMLALDAETLSALRGLKPRAMRDYVVAHGDVVPVGDMGHGMSCVFTRHELDRVRHVTGRARTQRLATFADEPDTHSPHISGIDQEGNDLDAD